MLKAGTAARRRTLSWDAAESPEAIQQQITALLHAIDERLQPMHAEWVGHVKIMLINGPETIYGSITAAADQVRWAGKLSAALRQGELTVYAAIYSLSDAQVAQAVDGALTTLAGQAPIIPLADAHTHEH
jgi:hypothetical protein